MKLVFVVRDAAELVGYRLVKKTIESLLPQATVFLICAERNPQSWADEEQLINVFQKFDAFVKAFSHMSAAELAHEQSKSDLPMNLYQSSPHYVYRERPERDLVIEQLYIDTEVRQLFKEMQPDFVFAGAAGHLIWTVTSLVAEQLAIPSYRLLGLSNLNPGSRGVRYWFTRNIEGRISKDSRDVMGWPKEEVREFVVGLLNGIRDESYRLDFTARTIHRSIFLSQGWRAILMDLRRWLRGGDQRAQSRIRSVWNDIHNSRLATPVAQLKTPYIVYPMNMPADEQLTLRAPHLRDIFSSIEQIANVLPYGYTLIIKEHPVHPGMLDCGRLKRLLKRRANVKFVPNTTNIHTLLAKASILITVNSTAAIDALVRGVPVVTIGETYYKGTGLTYDVEYMYQLANTLKQAIRDSKAEDRQQTLITMMSCLFQESYPGAEVLEVAKPEEAYVILAKGVVHKVKTYSGLCVADE